MKKIVLLLIGIVISVQCFSQINILQPDEMLANSAFQFLLKTEKSGKFWNYGSEPLPNGHFCYSEGTFSGKLAGWNKNTATFEIKYITRDDIPGGSEFVIASIDEEFIRALDKYIRKNGRNTKGSSYIRKQEFLKAKDGKCYLSINYR